MSAVNEKEQFISILKGRAAIYEFFSLVLAGPPGKQLIGLSGQFIPAFEELGESAASGVELLKNYAEKEAGMGADDVLHVLATNYTTLFYLGLGSIPTSESVYRSSARLVKQEPWEDVMAFYHIRKYKRPEQIREPEDHISIELDFMKFMCNLSLYMIDNGYEDKLGAAFQEQQRFMNEHLLKWVRDFCGNILGKSKYDELGLYTAVAFLLPAFLESETELLTHLLN